MNKNRLIRTFFIILLGITIGGITTFFQIKNENKSGRVIDTPSVTAKNFGGTYTLTNHLGETVTDKDFRDNYKLVYFGFTYCPAICPTELQKIAQVLKTLDPAIADQIKPIFISVDPERDTVEVMKEYVELFHPRLIGLTGTPEQVKVAKDAYKIYAAKVEDDTMQEYTVDHSSFIYFMGPEDTLYRIFKIDDAPEVMVDFINAHFAT